MNQINIPESWRDIPGYPDYQVSNKLRVRQMGSDGYEVIRTRILPDGNEQVMVWNDGIHTNHLVIYLHALAYPELYGQVYSDDGEIFMDLEDDKAKLLEAFKQVLGSINAADNHGLNNQMAEALVKRAVEEGWKPEGYDQQH